MVLPKRLSILTVLTMGLVLGGAGCDLAEEDEDLGPFLGSWVTQDLSVDGISVEAQLDARYDRLVLTLREGARGGEFFSIVGREEGATEDLFVQGTFNVDANELRLSPDTGLQVEFVAEIPDSSGARLRLTAEEGASEDRFLELIQLPIQGAVDRLEISLAKGKTQAAPGSSSPPG